ncbi:MAG: AMP-binding protein, partial [Opitutaceae bacterium]
LQAQALIVDRAAAPAAVAAATKLGISVLSLEALQGETEAPGEAAPSQPDDIALVLHTSGTTSRPKIVPLTQRNLALSAQNIARSLQLEREDRCLNIMPLFHVHGLIGAVLSSLTAGASVVCTPGFAAVHFFQWLEEFAPTWYTGVPTMHQAVVAAAGSNGSSAPRSRLRFIRSCSSALPPTLMAELEKTMGAPVVEAFGMTEAAHQAACNPLPPRARKPGSVGVATGTEITVLDAAPPGADGFAIGEIALKGAGITRGYESPPEANATAFTDGWFRTGDQGHIDSDGYVFLTGRIKELINRGGEKIAPREIDEALLAHPAVAQAVAFAVPHPTLGEDVAAAVVLRSGATADPEEIRASTFERLAAFKAPSMVVVVD